MVATTTANVSQSRGEDGSKSRKAAASNGAGGGVEKAKASNLCRQLQMRLQYARLKVEYGWQKQTLNEVENLYFHLSHTRPKSLKFAPQSTMVVANPPAASEVPPMTSGSTANTAAYGISPIDRPSTLSYLARNGLSVPSDTGHAQEESGSGLLNSPTNPLPTPPSMDSTPDPGSNPTSNPNPQLSSQAFEPDNPPAHAEGSSQLHFNPITNLPIQKTTHPTTLSSPPDPPPHDSSQQLLPPPLKPLGRPPTTPSIIPPEFVSTFGVYMPPPGPASNDASEELASPEGDPTSTNKSAKGKAKASEANVSPSMNNTGAASSYAVASAASPLRRHNSSSLSFISGAGGVVPAMTYDAFWSSHGAAGRTVSTVGTVSTTAPHTMVPNGPGTAVGAGMQST